MMTENSKIKILISSVGSFVGQNILDVFEYQGFYRRNLVSIIGTNSLAESPNNFRCDVCYSVPDTSHPDFIKIMISIIENEQPDIIFSARDEDSVVVALIMKDNSQLSGLLPCGDISTLFIGLNKAESLRFSQRHDLPFATSFVSEISGSFDDLKAFVNNVGFPLISKPLKGFASKGVVFVRNWEELLPLYEEKINIFQEYLGNPDTLEDYFYHFTKHIPLFIYSCTSDNNLFMCDYY